MSSERTSTGRCYNHQLKTRREDTQDFARTRYTARVLMYYSIVQHDSVILIVLLLLMLNYLRLGKLTKTALLTFHFISVWFTQKYMRAQAVVVMLS